MRKKEEHHIYRVSYEEIMRAIDNWFCQFPRLLDEYTGKEREDDECGDKFEA